ncbi:MAG: hypothetical protein MUE81_14985, partial [Thermoflexibacter sp.]|nr:hypothetical protein [Thermoflexibacter sp.]
CAKIPFSTNISSQTGSPNGTLIQRTLRKVKLLKTLSFFLKYSYAPWLQLHLWVEPKNDKN